MSGARKFWRLLLPPVLVTAGRRLRRLLRQPSSRFAAGRGIPWSPGYVAFRAERVVRSLEDDELVERFRQSVELPPGYGVGVDERIVEYPWVLAQLGPCPDSTPERLLDAGSALNHPFLVGRPELTGRDLHILTLAPEAHCFWKHGISYIYGDLRDLPARDEYYDAVVSISTLEHVGKDNSQFVGASESHGPRTGGAGMALREIWRVLRPGGRLLFTVPYGRRQVFPGFQQFDADGLAELLAVLPADSIADFECRFFRYRASGWNVARAVECEDAEFVPWIMEDPAERGPFPDHADRAAAARAVACVRISKAGPTGGNG